MQLIGANTILFGFPNIGTGFWSMRSKAELGECKQGMDIAYDGTWGYHPLLISLANTRGASVSGQSLRQPSFP